jgi:hypothetical protein
MAEDSEGKTLEESGVYHGMVGFTKLEMRVARDFEGLVDYRLARLKAEVMEIYRLQRSPFPELDEG